MTAKEQREARLAAQLRENLRRRKVAARVGAGGQQDATDTTPLSSSD